MTAFAIILILMSAFIHASWNFIVKRTSPTAGFFFTANIFGAWIFFPWVIIYPGIVPGMPAKVWVLLVLTGLFQALYLISLAAAYRHGDLSVSYPISRSLPVILVPIAAFLLGRGGMLGAMFLAGTGLVVAGGTLVSLDEIRSLKHRFTMASVLPMAFLAAVGTAGYSLLDDQALRIMRSSLGHDFGNVPITLVYTFLEAFTCAAWVGVWMVLTGKRARENRVPLGWAAGAGMLMYITYGMVLLSMAYSRDVSLIVAFRQVSILIGALLGFVFLKEAPKGLKITGLMVLFTGLVIVAVS